MKAFIDAHRSAHQGVRRGRSVPTTIRNAAQPCPLDKVNRQFKAARPNAGFVLDALEQAIHARGPQGGLIHHSDRGSQYLAPLCSQRLLGPIGNITPREAEDRYYAEHHALPLAA